MYWDPPFPITTWVVEFNDFAFAFSVQECLTLQQKMKYVESVGNMRQQQNKQFLAWGLNKENEMKHQNLGEPCEGPILKLVNLFMVNLINK